MAATSPSKCDDFGRKGSTPFSGTQDLRFRVAENTSCEPSGSNKKTVHVYAAATARESSGNRLHGLRMVTRQKLSPACRPTRARITPTLLVFPLLAHALPFNGWVAGRVYVP